MSEYKYFIATNGESKTKYMANNNVEELDLMDLPISKFVNYYRFKLHFADVLNKDIDLSTSNIIDSDYVYTTESLYTLVKDYLFTAIYEFYDYENISKGITYQIFIEARINRLLTHLYVFKRDYINNEFSLVKDSELTKMIRYVLKENPKDDLNIIVTPSLYEAYEIFVKSIKNSLGKFNKAMVHINDNGYNVTKSEEGRIWFGNKPNQNQDFKKILDFEIQRSNPMVYTLRVTTDSKYDDKELFSELYGFKIELIKTNETDFDFTLNYINIDELKYASIEADRKRKTNISDHTVFCDLNGEKVLL